MTNIEKLNPSHPTGPFCPLNYLLYIIIIIIILAVAKMEWVNQTSSKALLCQLNH